MRLKKHEKTWAGEIATLAQFYKFRRGFVERACVSAADFLAHAERLFQIAPRREICLDNIGDQMPALVASPHFCQAETLSFSPYIMDQLHYDGRLEVLLGCPQLANVRGLDLDMSSLTDENVQSVTQCPYLGALKHLDLSSNRISALGFRAVANAKQLPALCSLRVFGNSQVNADGMRAIVDSPLAERLEQLELNFHQFGDEPVRILAAAPRLKKLCTLDLSDNNITDAGAKALTEAKNLEGLQRLTLRGHRKTLGKDGRELLKKRFGKDVCVF